MLELSPHATLVTTWFMLERLAGDYRIPLDRCRWVRDGETFDAGDRVLLAQRPPIFDSPTTRGLFDPRTGVYWASDSFASHVPDHVVSAADIPGPMFEETFLHLSRLVSPWITIADPVRHHGVLNQFKALEAKVVASAHGSALTGDVLARAVELMRVLPDMDEAIEPGQADLEQMLAGLMAA